MELSNSTRKKGSNCRRRSDIQNFLGCNPLLSDLQLIDSSAFQNSVLPPLPIAQMNNGEVEDNECEKKTKKRRRNQVDLTLSSKIKSSKFVQLSADDLLKLDSAEIEEYIRNITSLKTLAPSEEKELKRIRRLIKNREYAQSSRNKKKQYMEEMEKKLSEVEEGRDKLQKRVDELEQENRALKMQLAKIGSVIKTDPSIVEKLKDAVASNSKLHPSTRQKKAQVLQTGVVLFMIALSFGFLFRPEPRLNQGSIYNTGRKILSNTEGFLPSLLASYAPDFVVDFAAVHIYAPNDSNISEFRNVNLGPTTVVKPKVTVVRKVYQTLISEIQCNPFLENNYQSTIMRIRK